LKINNNDGALLSGEMGRVVKALKMRGNAAAPKEKAIRDSGKTGPKWGDKLVSNRNEETFFERA
jgi:hypothetical protein